MAIIILVILLIIAVIFAIYYAVVYYNRVRAVNDLQNRVNSLQSKVDNACNQINQVDLSQIQNTNVMNLVQKAQQACRQ